MAIDIMVNEPGTEQSEKTTPRPRRKAVRRKRAAVAPATGAPVAVGAAAAIVPTSSPHGSRAVVLTPVYMATAMWNHGETMLARMTEAGLSWPVFNDQEMVDLLAYLDAPASSPSEAEPGDR